MDRFWAPMLVTFLLGGCEACDPEIVDPTAGRLVVEPTSLRFNAATVGERAEQTIRLDNVGTAPLTTAPSLVSNDFRVLPDTGIELDAGESLELTVRFAPTVAAEVAATLRFSNTTPAVTVALSGRGTTLPLCDDGNDCTDDTYQVSLSTCAYTFHERSCDPDNACVQDAACSNGGCLGSFIECAAPTSTCRESYCDSQVGCTERDIPGACDDGDPCTDDVCTPTGCAHPPAEDGTNCGEYVQCQSVAICQAGQCNVIPVPDGAPCEDGNVCTADSCQAGQCVGVESGPGAPEVNQQRNHVLTAAQAATSLTGGRVAVLQPRDGAGADPGGTDLLLLADTSLTSSPNWTLDAAQPLDATYIDALGLDDGRLVLATADGLAVFAPEEDGWFAEAHPVTPAAGPDVAITSLLMARGEFVFGCGTGPVVAEAFVAHIPPDGPPVHVPSPFAGWPCSGPFLNLRALPQHGLITSPAPSSIEFWDVSNAPSVIADVHSFMVPDPPSAPFGWETTGATGVFETGIADDGGLWAFDFDTFALTAFSFSFPGGIVDVRGVGDRLYVLGADEVLYAADNPGPQTTFAAVAFGISRLEPIGPDLIALRDGTAAAIHGLHSIAGTVDGRIGAVGALHTFEQNVALQNQHQLSMISPLDLSATASVFWQGQVHSFTPRIVLQPAGFEPKLRLLLRTGPIPTTARAQVDAYAQFSPSNGSELGTFDIAGLNPQGLDVVLHRLFVHGGHPYALDVFETMEGQQDTVLHRIHIAPSVASWAPAWSETIAATTLDVIDVHLGWGPDRIVVVGETSDESFVMSLVDVSDVDAPAVIGGPIFSAPGPSPGSPVVQDHTLAVADHTVVYVYRDEDGFTLHRVTFVPGSPTSGYDTVFSPADFADAELRVLQIADPFVILGGDDRVLYLDLETMSVQHEIAVVGHPQHAVGQNGNLYVASDTTVTEIFPPCP